MARANSGILDVTVGPAATENFGLEIDSELGVPGAGTLVDTAFFEPQPPSGVGMRCSIVDQFSYGQVRVTANRLTITPKGIDGRPQRQRGRGMRAVRAAVPRLASSTRMRRSLQASLSTLRRP